VVLAAAARSKTEASAQQKSILVLIGEKFCCSEALKKVGFVAVSGQPDLLAFP
jgi:hypothetical protein